MRSYPKGGYCHQARILMPQNILRGLTFILSVLSITEQGQLIPPGIGMLNGHLDQVAGLELHSP